MTITNHGVQVISSRQWTTGVSPNAAGDDWNYIVDYIGDAHPHQWLVLKNFTTDPVEQVTETLQSIYTNQQYGFGAPRGQLRAANGRIFFPQVKGYVTYYEPTDETIHQIGPIVEDPPIDPNVSTIFFAAMFDTGGKLYLVTQESEYRPVCVVRLDPDTLAMDILGYVGSGALSFTTYGKNIAVDTGTASRFVYVAYGEAPWQLWALNVDTGETTKLYEVPATGSISFTNMTGKGWRATIHTNLGQSDDVVTFKWCIDGALENYTTGVDPSSPRNVTPASNPLVDAPDVDVSGGAGILRWRDSTSDPYTTVNYTVNYAVPVVIESLVATETGVAGNAEQYNGVFDFDEASGRNAWYGPWTNGLSEGPRLNVDGTIYLAGYPNGVLEKWIPGDTWDLGVNPPATAINPKQLGFYGLNGTQFAGIKYARHMAWSEATGRVYCAGDRERNGTGMGVGYCIVESAKFAGVYSSSDGSTGPSAMSSLLAAGLTINDNNGLVIVTTKTISGTGSAPLFVFSQALSSSTTYTPFVGVPALGPVCPTAANDIIAGAFIRDGLLNLYRFNVLSGEVLISVGTEFSGAINAYAINPLDGALWLSVGSTLVGVNPNTLLTKTIDVSSIAPVSCLAASGSNMYMSSGATLFSAPIPSTSFTVPHIDPNVLFGSGEIGRALGVPEFFDLLISTLNEMGLALSVPTLDANILRATASAGKAIGVPVFYGTIVSTVNACASVLHQPAMDTNILTPASKTGEAFGPPDFYAAVISKVNDLINHL